MNAKKPYVVKSRFPKSAQEIYSVGEVAWFTPEEAIKLPKGLIEPAIEQDVKDLALRRAKAELEKVQAYELQERNALNAAKMHRDSEIQRLARRVLEHEHRHTIAQEALARAEQKYQEDTAPLGDQGASFLGGGASESKPAAKAGA